MKKIISQVIWPKTLVTTYEDGQVALLPYDTAEGVDLFPNDGVPTTVARDACVRCGESFDYHVTEEGLKCDGFKASTAREL